MKVSILIFNLFLIFLFGCQSSSETVPMVGNPAADGFNQAASDPQAIQIADQVMEAMGGRKAWDDTNVIGWNFNGRRYLIWDKSSGDVRIDVPQDSTVYLINIHDHTGKVYRKGQEQTDPDSVRLYTKKGEAIWINDSYWLVMPFKLKDSGVTLKYMEEDTTQTGVKSDVLQLTFKNVGNTPDNMYKVWVDQADHLVKQWAYYASFDQEKPPAIWPWDHYQTYGEIKLSSDRSDGRGPKLVQVLSSVPEAVFTDVDQPSLVKF
ncbi:MAG: hypothetical protein KDC53_22090 [Saprospiraceae bacterium]|nr:hypothetical protein [Saprospiraceae bacterium]